MAIHKGPWQKEEDAVLCEQVTRHNGANAWGKIAEELGTRSAKQCRERWHQNLKPGLMTGPITNEEARFITQYVQSRGKRWAEIARQMNGRSDNMIKNWWNGSNNRRQREQCEYRRGPEAASPTATATSAPQQQYPMRLQQPLPSFQASYPQGYAPVRAPSHSYGPPSLPTSSPVEPPSSVHYSREQSNLFDRRQEWNMPSLQISPTQSTQESRPSLSAVTTPSSAGPPTPRYAMVRRASSTDCGSLRPYDDDRMDLEIVHSSSRRGSAYEAAQQNQYRRQRHDSIPDLSPVMLSAGCSSQQQQASKSKMSLSNILS